MTKPLPANKALAPNALATKFQAQLSTSMMGLFDLVVSDRGGYYAQHADKIPDVKSVPSLINSWALTNAAISGGASLIPGPWGMLAVVPEIAAVIRNQLVLIYDIGMAYGKGRVLTKELLAGVLLTAMGASAGAVLIMQGNKVLVRRVSLRLFQRIIALLGGKITHQEA